MQQVARCEEVRKWAVFEPLSRASYFTFLSSHKYLLLVTTSYFLCVETSAVPSRSTSEPHFNDLLSLSTFDHSSFSPLPTEAIQSSYD